MDNRFKQILHEEINEPLNKIVEIFTPKPKKPNYKLSIFWAIVGFLAIILLYYSYGLLYIYF